ncbi:MAG: DUF427 domain-containing protein [Actinomycetota bacterium]|nr:DUF427 domain-containing protein [Actinomycetota bacterium]
MSIRLRDTQLNILGELRHEPTAKRVRAIVGGDTVVDSTRAVLLWEPRRVVPAYAVPAEDIAGDLVTAGVDDGVDADRVGLSWPDVSGRPILDPSIPFGIHTASGEPVDIKGDGQRSTGAAFRLADPDLAGYVVLDFAAFDVWYEEDEPIFAHPHNPFDRIDVRASSRQVRFESKGAVIAESSRPKVLFETLLPTRYYLPPEDVRVPLVPSETRTWCAYKGEASYWSAQVGAGVIADIAWSYHDPLHDAAQVQGLIAFFNERLDVVLDGRPVERPVTPWS